MRLLGQLARVATTMALDPRATRRRASFAPTAGGLAFLAAVAACHGDNLTTPGGLRTTPPDLTLTGGVGTQIFSTVPVGEDQPFGVAVGLNTAGQVTGSAFFGPVGDFKPFRWSASTGVQSITGCCDTMWGNDINDAGVVVGTAQTSLIVGTRGFVAAALTTTPLSILPGGDPELNAAAVAINNAGQIVGASIAPGFATHAVLWSATGVIQDLGTLGGTNSLAIDINGSGQVIGSSLIAGDAATHYFLWSSATGMVDLNATIDPNITSVVEINGAGQIVGTFKTGGQSHAFLYTPGATLRDLGTLGGATSVPTGLNDRGDVVGASALTGGSTHAFLWTAAEGMEDITVLSGVLEVRRLNDNLQTLTGTLAPSPLPRTGQLRPRLVQLQVTQSNAPPTALFTAECNGLTCVLDASGSLDDKPGLTYAWHLDRFPGGFATGSKVTVTYPHAGLRNVTLTVTDAQGLKNSVSHTLAITNFPIASFTASCVGLTCSFDASASTSDVKPLELDWRFGDGEVGFNVVAPTHTFAQAGVYPVTLEVLDSSIPGKRAVITMQVTVGTVEKQSPVAAFTYSCAGLPHAHQCAFDASRSTDDLGIVSYRWEWGNGHSATQTAPTVRNTWAAPGTYNVTLRVADADGLIGVIRQHVVVP